MKVQLKLAAKRRGLRVRMHADDTSITFQFFDPNAQQQEQTTAPTKSKK
jgi:hypothetical protein